LPNLPNAIPVSNYAWNPNGFKRVSGAEHILKFNVVV